MVNASFNKRVDFPLKPSFEPQREIDLYDKDYSLYFAKYLASIDSLKEEYKNYAWLDGVITKKAGIDEDIIDEDELDDDPDDSIVKT